MFTRYRPHRQDTAQDGMCAPCVSQLRAVGKLLGEVRGERQRNGGGGVGCGGGTRQDIGFTRSGAVCGCPTTNTCSGRHHSVEGSSLAEATHTHTHTRQHDDTQTRCKSFFFCMCACYGPSCLSRISQSHSSFTPRRKKNVSSGRKRVHCWSRIGASCL